MKSCCTMLATMLSFGLVDLARAQSSLGLLPAFGPGPQMKSAPLAWRAPEWLPQVKAPKGHWAQSETDRPSRLGPALYASAALALAAGGFALWSKHEADNAYERYLKNASQARQQSHYSRAKRLDRVTGAAYAAMEVGVVLTAYFIFF